MADYKQAFVACDILFRNNHFIETVVIPERNNRGELMIVIYPINTAALFDRLQIIITQNHLAEVQKLLGENRPAVQAPCAEYELDDFGVALQALKEIATIDFMDSDGHPKDLTWREFTKACIDIAENALAKIEADDATPSDPA